MSNHRHGHGHGHGHRHRHGRGRGRGGTLARPRDAGVEGAVRVPAPTIARAAARHVARLAVAVLLSVVPPAAFPAGVALDLDTADAETLAAALPGIGPVKARAIVAHRERYGPFVDLDALLEVRGIGPKTLARVRAALEPIAAGTGAVRDGGAASAPATRARAAEESASLERAARAAVRELVALAVADAERARAERTADEKVADEKVTDEETADEETADEGVARGAAKGGAAAHGRATSDRSPLGGVSDE